MTHSIFYKAALEDPHHKLVMQCASPWATHRAMIQLQFSKAQLSCLDRYCPFIQYAYVVIIHFCTEQAFMPYHICTMV